MSGLIRRRGLVGVRRVSTLSFVSQFSDTDLDQDIVLPSGLSETDFIVYAEHTIVKEDDGDPAAAVPAGFTQWMNMVGGAFSGRIVVSYKILAPSDSSTTITPAMTGASAFGYLGAMIYRANAPITALTASTPTQEVTSGNPSPQTILTGSANLPVVAFAVISNMKGDVVAGESFSPTEDGVLDITSGDSETFLFRKLYNSSPSNITVDMNDEGTNNALASGFIAVS